MNTSTPPLRILYGVQGTGQGHITRARVLGPALKKAGAQVDFLFSGRQRDELYGMEEFGDFQLKRGLTFSFNQGKVSPLATIFNNSAHKLLSDIARLDLSKHDLVITDYEPITAWAAKIRKIPSIGIGHQYAFNHEIPKDGFNKLSSFGMRNFAPAKTGLGVHWHPFGQAILPPIFELPATDKAEIHNKILVYLNFEELDQVKHLLENFTDHDFYVYTSSIKHAKDEGHIKYRPPSLHFKKDLEDCEGIICGAGFELPTEAMHMGKKILVKPMGGQPEQLSNVLALKELGLADSMETLDKDSVSTWLEKPKSSRIIYPDTATAVAQWVMRGDWQNTNKLVSDLWGQAQGLDM